LRVITVFLLAIFSSVSLSGQHVVVKGKVYSEYGEVLAGAVVRVVNSDFWVISSDSSGFYHLSIPRQNGLVIEARFLGFHPQQEPLDLTGKDEVILDFFLKSDENWLKTVEIVGNKESSLPGISTLKIDPKIPKYLPSAFGDFNKVIATIGFGVATNSELSSNYTVRGGNYDENLVYVNGLEVYRPFLVKSGQQEGLSFVNPDLVEDIEFSAGGWQPKLGDKLSSVLSVKYREPKKFKGTFTAGLLGGAIHFENRSANKRFSYLVGLRQKSAQYLLNTLQTKGEYKPKFYDVQSMFTYDLTSKANFNSTPKKTTLSLLLTYARNRYLVIPSSRETSFGTNDQVLRLNVDFEGQEIMNYDNYQGGLILAHRFSQKFKADFSLSTLFSREVENYDLISKYRLCEVVTDPNSIQFNQCAFERGTGGLLDHARNELKANVITLKHTGTYAYNAYHTIEYGVQLGKEEISDRLSEYSYLDSSGFVAITKYINASAGISSYRPQAYIQHQYTPDSSHFLTYGVRINYWTLNNQLLVSPRIQYAWKPKFNDRLTLKVGAGVYQQPPFFRELRDARGNINESVKAQTSYHLIAGSDLLFKAWNRDFKFSTEAYYKYLENVIPYDIDNVRLRYFALNNAR
ncbi:MAG TPA: TonB-dependent receptor plug domain-containing protein, partial [Cytophagaceae bacterium]